MAETFPTPWIVGPFGDIWVAADVEFRDGRWCETIPEPRLVVTMAGKPPVVAKQIVDAVNAAAMSPADRCTPVTVGSLPSTEMVKMGGTAWCGHGMMASLCHECRDSK